MTIVLYKSFFDVWLAYFYPLKSIFSLALIFFVLFWVNNNCQITVFLIWKARGNFDCNKGQHTIINEVMPTIHQCWKLLSDDIIYICNIFGHNVQTLDRPFAWWRHFTTMTSILQGFAFLCKLGLSLFKPHCGYIILILKEKRKEFWVW